MVELLAVAHVLAWSIYVGGALIMELVLRHAQGSMRPSQVAVVCQRAGRRYRWWSFAMLALLAASGVPLAYANGAPGFDPGSSYGRTLWLLTAIWAAQLGVLSLLAFRVHPAMHARADAGMSEEEIAGERQRVRRAIVSMDRLLRLELGGAIAAMAVGATLHQGGLI